MFNSVELVIFDNYKKNKFLEMKKILCLLLSVITISFSATAQVGKTLPSTQIKNSNGQSLAFNKIFTPGVVTIVSVWNIGCLPCREELNAVKNKIGKWKKEANIDYKIISIDDARAMNRAKGFAKSQGWPFEDYYDPNSDLKRFLNFQEIPFTFIVDKFGKVAFMHTSYKPGSEDIIFARAKELTTAKN